MTGTFTPLAIRKALGRDTWGAPAPHGPDGWSFRHIDRRSSVIVSADVIDGVNWLHASIARPTMPTYDDLALLRTAVFPGFAYQVFAPPERHINIHATALHLWGRADGRPVLPDFGAVLGTI